MSSSTDQPTHMNVRISNNMNQRPLPTRDVVRQTIEFKNGLRHPVGIGFRDGTRFQLNSRALDPKYSSCLQIIVRYEYSESVKLDPTHISSVVPQDFMDAARETNESKMLRCFENALVQTNGRDPEERIRSAEMVYEVQLDDLVGRGPNNQHWIHIPALGLIVGLGGIDKLPRHPYQRAEEPRPKKNDFMGAEMHLEIVDPHMRYKHRYMQVARQVIEVPIIRSSFKDPGAYLYTSRLDHDGRKQTVIFAKSCELEEMDKVFGLYSTPELAAGEPDESVRWKNDYDHNKREQERTLMEEQAKLVREKAEFERIRHQEKMEYERRREANAERSDQRKESLDMLKYLPLAIVGIASVIKGLFSLFSSDEE